MALIFFLSLISHSDADPSWTTWTTQGEIRNWIGRLGSTFSDLFFQVFGLSAFLLPVILLFRSLRRLESAKRFWVPTVGFIFFCASLFQLSIHTSKLPLGLQTPGGLVGVGLEVALKYLTGSLGAYIVSSVGALLSLMLALQWRPAKWLQTIPKNETNKKFQKFFSRIYNALTVVKKLRFRIPRLRFPLRFRRVRPPAPTLIPVPAAIPVSGSHSPADPVTFLEAASEKDEDFAVAEKKTKPLAKKTYKMPLAAKSFQLPSPELLAGKYNRRAKTVDKQWYVEKGKTLVEKLNDFGVEGEVVHIAPGPVITVYEFKPASGIKIREIANLSDDLTLALSVLSVRIVAPIPGKPVVGIEIPTPDREVVSFKDVVQETNFYKSDRRIPIALGRLASGEPILTDLAAMPHLLVAGATGTGKSVFVNTLICSLLFRFAPQQLKLILVDPKMVELSHYEGIPHLLLPPVVDAKKAVLALRWLVEEMERRYQTLHEFGVRHVDAYNARLNEFHKQGLYTDKSFMPYIVTVIDEYADLMAVVAKEVEHSVTRLAQKARASGIHLVLATQRPSTDVVTGTIKANFPSRISFRVASSVDSKTILDRTGADRLLGNGDMLFHSAGFTTLKRMQGSFIQDQDIEAVIEHLKSQAPPEYDESILANLEAAEEGLPSDEEPSSDKDNALYDAAVRLVTERGEASISLIQRHLRIGYNRAATLMEQLEREGVVGQSTGASKRRAVLVNPI
ncbi:MAG: DNA translocase FtsK 4TM domain-containing protein [Bdellovibrionaceae bacterium]|nr:DNA translocase FtsK 4TM domain-containing protein [Bdellovibrionales bacterium]MCB9253323.1 DNA translocase FtsK 4TM domain-containing protein [Pseudobdellovibrionaceae bacterium]